MGVKRGPLLLDGLAEIETTVARVDEGLEGVPEDPAVAGLSLVR